MNQHQHQQYEFVDVDVDTYLLFWPSRHYSGTFEKKKNDGQWARNHHNREKHISMSSIYTYRMTSEFNEIRHSCVTLVWERNDADTTQVSPIFIALDFPYLSSLNRSTRPKCHHRKDMGAWRTFVSFGCLRFCDVNQKYDMSYLPCQFFLDGPC